MPPTQANKIAAIATSLGPDALVLKSVTIHERLGRMFQMEASLLANDAAIDFEKLIGKDATIRLDLPKRAKPRYFNGCFSRLVQTKNEDGFAQYHATLVSRLWFLTRTADCRIFQNMTVPAIVEMVLSEQKLTEHKIAFESHLSGNYPTLEYCVQYRETDFNFVSRLMEHAGLYYFFQHIDGEHTMVLCDSMGAHSTFQGYETIEFHPRGQPGTPLGDVVDWVLQKEVQTGLYALKDFDFTTPTKDLQSKANVSRAHTYADLEIYDYPGGYMVANDGANYAKLRIEELQCNYEIAHGQATARGIATGCTFTLNVVTEDLRKDQGREYLVTGADYHIDNGTFHSGAGSAPGQFSCSFSAIPKGQSFRPPRLTPKPLIQGPQTAIVVGPDHEEIDTDPYGRVKVKFHWDRDLKADNNYSCWVRVSQLSAGKGWGSMHIPRIGQEVIVEFLEGDPDQPIITGRVYNGASMPPYKLPAEKTKSTSKSNSSMGGHGFNEIRFEDATGKEQIFIHGEHDMDVRVKNDVKERYIGNHHHIVGWEKDGSKGGDQREMVYQDKHLKVHRAQIEQIGDSVQLLIGCIDSGQGNQDIYLQGVKKETIEKDGHLHVKGNRNEQVDGNQSLAIKGDQQETIGGKHAVVVSGTVHLKAGSTLVIEAGTQLSLKVGGNFVDIGAAGVSISGTMVKINSGGSPASGSGASPTAPADAAKAAPTAPTVADDAKTGQKSAPN